ncbi:hypothetical protein Maes01_01523 [Microbulbifer aestuariivivens]|uniref:Alginate export domain-containing protein n=1 Tax=Microbulbifer aestuariivivens TaxID=1908308 RepID=A0ABP9WRR7_9GAMM
MAPYQTGALILICALALLPYTPATLAQSGFSGATSGAPGTGPGYEALSPLQTGQIVDQVIVNISPAGLEDEQALSGEIRRALGISVGTPWNPALGARALAAVEAIPRVAKASYGPRRFIRGSRNALVVNVHISDTATPAATGVFQSGDPGDFPVLYRRYSSYLQAILNGGNGVFSDGNPWFDAAEVFTRGNPLVLDPALGAQTGSRASWSEAFVQLGLGGVMPLNHSSLYGFAAMTGIGVASVGGDIFRDQNRSTFDTEQAYAGMLYAPANTTTRIKISAGRQNYILNEGFLVSQFGWQFNAGPRPGVYLSPRTAADATVLGYINRDDWTAQLFHINPSIDDRLRPKSKLNGLNLRKTIDERLSIDGTLLHVADSSVIYTTPDGSPGGREGLWTAAAHLLRHAPANSDGFWLESEIAHQWNDHLPMSAYAGYATVGYIARESAWQPSLSYRLATFSGDDPNTETYERFDTLFSGGLNEWLQGISLAKLLTQANTKTNRLRFNVSPRESLNLTLDLYQRSANRRNNLGGNRALGTLSSKELGYEVDFVIRWSVSRRLFAQGLFGVAIPQRGVKDAADNHSQNWSTAQLQLFWTL